MSASMNIKLKHAVTGEIRLAHVPEDGDLIAALHHLAHELFHLPADAALRLCTLDADGDYLTLATAQEVREAAAAQLGLGRQTAMLHVFLAAAAAAAPRGVRRAEAAAAQAAAYAAEAKAAAHAHAAHAQAHAHAGKPHHGCHEGGWKERHAWAAQQGGGGCHSKWQQKWAHHAGAHPAMLWHLMARKVWGAHRRAQGCGEW